jgi:hypothetical protein
LYPESGEVFWHIKMISSNTP